MKQIEKGSWVQIKQTLLEAGERAPQVPEETQEVPLDLWVKGYLQEDAEIGDKVTIETIVGRTLEGELVAENPRYEHDFGKPIPELISVGKEFQELIQGADK
ncbi:2-amino-4-oxopentanoate thiolase subunit OrtA [Halanaerobaculum tunisiense]